MQPLTLCGQGLPLQEQHAWQLHTCCRCRRLQQFAKDKSLIDGICHLQGIKIISILGGNAAKTRLAIKRQNENNAGTREGSMTWHLLLAIRV